MRRIAAIILILFVLAEGALTPIKIDSPAATGMNSNSDLQELRITDASFLQNVNTQRSPGYIDGRDPLHSVGDNNVKVLAAFGYFDFAKKMKQIVAVSPKASTDSLIKGYQGGAVTYNTLSTDSMAVWLRASNRFETGVQDTTIKIAGFLGAPPYNAELFDGALFVTSKGNVPLVYYPYGASGSGWSAPDSAFYKPHSFSMGLEAPGQLRVGVLNDPGVTFGSYRYVYGIKDSNTYSIPSRWVTADSQDIFVTLFEQMPYQSPDMSGGDSAATFKVEIARQKFGSPLWYRLDTFTMKGNQNVVYIDSKEDNFSYNSTAFGGANEAKFIKRFYSSSGKTPPGGLRRNPPLDSVGAPPPNVECDGVRCATEDSVYYFGYSYYDPISGAESPLGPICYGTVTDSLPGASWGPVAFAFTKGYTKIYERAPWIRVYRGTMKDSTIFYGVCQQRANLCMTSNVSNNWTVYPGAPNDTGLQNGQQTEKDDTLSVIGQLPYVRNDIFQAEDGTAFVRPPYIEQLEVGYTDIAYANGRFWGIGDPLFPARVYFSNYDDPYQWSALDYFDMSPNVADELVAIEIIPIQGGDFALPVLFKHNSMYELQGYDPEFDLTWRTVSSEIGAISNRTVTQKDGTIYWLAMDMRVYSYSGSGQPKEISKPIENYIDTLFRDADTARQKCVVYVVQDKIVFSDTANSRSLVYVPRNDWWGLETYPSDFEPIGSFHYNSSRRNFSKDQFDYWIYQGGTGEKFVLEINPPAFGLTADTINGSTSNFLSIYRTPYIGDGEYIYQITKVDFLGRAAPGVMKIRIRDGWGNMLDSTFLTDNPTPASRLRTIYLPEHTGSYLALEFQDWTSAQRFEISRITMHYRRVGRVEGDGTH